MQIEKKQIEDIEREIHQYFAQIGETAKREEWHKDSHWTVGINRYMTQLGHKHDFQVFASRCDIADGPEWLYDLHWRSLNEKGNLSVIPLVMEIEWGFGAATIKKKVIKDFTKLIQARAGLRVMVFQGDSIESFIDDLENIVREFLGTQPGDRYILAGWEWGTDNMIIRSLII